MHLVKQSRNSTPKSFMTRHESFPDKDLCMECHGSFRHASPLPVNRHMYCGISSAMLHYTAMKRNESLVCATRKIKNILLSTSVY